MVWAPGVALQVSFIAGEAISKGIFQGRPAWREQILRGAREQQVRSLFPCLSGLCGEVVELQTRLELRFSTSAGGAKAVVGGIC